MDFGVEALFAVYIRVNRENTSDTISQAVETAAYCTILYIHCPPTFEKMH